MRKISAETIILGGGLAGLSLADALRGSVIVLEKEKALGGLCRSFMLNGVNYDIGPHILFSKNRQVLDRLTALTQVNLLRRSNKIFHGGKFVKYPFENDLASLSAPERDRCVGEFIHNPYEKMPADNMLQFFLKTFGEGITRLYLQPYNEKIWKFDPAFMDTQMVERIPKPPKEDVLKSARGIPTEGYLHQLYFNYPKKGGISALITGLAKRLNGRARIINPIKIISIKKSAKIWTIRTDKGIFTAPRLVNCMPLHELFKYISVPADVKPAFSDLKYNSIHIAAISAKKDGLGNNFAATFADKSLIFHRLSKINFLGPEYRPADGSSVLLAEVTFRPGSYLSKMSREAIVKKIEEDLNRINLVKKRYLREVVLGTFEYAYVIYDLNHRKNTDKVLKYLADIGITSCGRFAEFEYLNMDMTAERSMKTADRLNAE